MIDPAWITCASAEDSAPRLAAPLETRGKEKGSSHRGNKGAADAETFDGHSIIPTCRKIITRPNVLWARAAIVDFGEPKAFIGEHVVQR